MLQGRTEKRYKREPLKTPSRDKSFSLRYDGDGNQEYGTSQSSFYCHLFDVSPDFNHKHIPSKEKSVNLLLPFKRQGRRDKNKTIKQDRSPPSSIDLFFNLDVIHRLNLYS